MTTMSESARRLFSRCLYHHDDDPRRLLTGAEEGKQLLGMSMQQALSHVQTLGERGAWVTCVAPSQAHCRLVREAFESPSKQAQHDDSLQPPGAGPYSGRVVTLPLQGKTSATMLMGCASGISPADENALPLSLAVDALGGSFTSRLMAEVRESRADGGINAQLVERSAHHHHLRGGHVCTLPAGEGGETHKRFGARLARQWDYAGGAGQS